MLFRNYFNGFVFFLLVTLSQVAVASVVEAKCGRHIFQVKILNEKDAFERKFILSYKTKAQDKKVFYSTAKGIDLLAACIKNNKNHFVMLFQEFCGGNGCPEDMYGVFDPISGKMLISPVDWPKGNYKQVEKIIGYPLLSLVGDKRSFCCNG